MTRPYAKTLAEAILNAAGSALRHYTPESQKRIIEAADKELDALKTQFSQVVQNVSQR